MHLTQSAVSQLTQQLEDALGLHLFDRTSRPLRPTPVADSAAVIVERLLSDLDALRGLAQRRSGTVLFACATSLASTLLPVVLKKFLELHPNVTPVMRDAQPDKVRDLVLTENVEFGVLMRLDEARHAEFHLLRSDSLGVVFREDSPLAKLARIQWKDLSDQRVIAIDAGSGLPKLIQRMMAAEVESFEPAYSFSYLHTALGITAQGLGVVLLPSFLVQSALEGQGLQWRELVEPVVPRHLYLLKKQGHALSACAEALVEVLSSSLANLPAAR